MLVANDMTDDSKTLVIERMLNAPRTLVWKMFSDPYHLAQWWGPKGFANRVETLDFRTGGSWRHVMIGPDGHEYPTEDTIVEVAPPERIVYRSAPASTAQFGDNPPPGFTKTITLDEVEGGTLLRIISTFDTAEHREAVARRGFSAGMNESLDKLETVLGQAANANRVTVPTGADHFSIERSFDAPRRLVWTCYTEPQHLARFWGPRDATTKATIDLRVGGVWRTDWTYENGGQYSYSSVYLELVEPERIHYRDAPVDWAGGLDGLPPAELVTTIKLTEQAGRTTVLAHVKAASVELRDQTVARGFAGMVSTGNDRLAEYLETLTAEGGA